MTSHNRPTVVSVLVVLLLLAAGQGWAETQPAPGSLPWENPNSGFDKPSSGGSGSGGTDKIETVINTSGGSKDDGKTISNSGTDKQKGFVNDFLNNASEKIKNSGGGSGWVWTWQKKWTIGPDGKPAEVKEDWQKGEIGTNAKSSPAPTPGPSSGPSSSSPSNPSSSSAPSSPASPKAGPSTSPSSPKATPSGTKAVSAPAKTSTPSTPTGKPAAPTTKATAPAPAPAPTGVEVAPPKLPPAEVQLVIQDPVDQVEKAYPKNVFPKETLPVTPLVDKNQPVPEDTRVKITLDFDRSKIREEDLTLTVTDNEGDTEVPKDEMGNYRHIFRIPDLQRYSARVNYRHPITGSNDEIIRVTIPVHPLDFKNRTIEANQNRSSNDDSSPAAAQGGTLTGSAGTAGGSQGGGARGGDSASARTYGGGGGDSATGDSYGTAGKTDLSDLYSDPSQDLVAGAGAPGGETGAAGSSGLDGQRLAGLSGAGGPTGADAASGYGAANGGAPGAPGQEADAAVSGGGSSRRGGGSRSEYRTGAAGGGGDSSSSSGGEPGSGAEGSASGWESSAGPAGDTTGHGGSSAGDGYYDSGNTRMAAANTTTAQFGTTQDESTTQDRAYLISLSVRNPVTKAAQSFDFIQEPFPTATAISKNTQLSFSLDLSKDVNRESVNVVVFDGKDKKQMTLGSGGEAFDHLFAQPTAEAYIWIYGSSNKAPFSYKLSIPVADL
ncbi:MAG: hypothetical protein GX442_17280 [Candidatus Riflebacteria bacterium]|nr:hypothetical protein [Candidatus Riflebacteria bacterium]